MKKTKTEDVMIQKITTNEYLKRIDKMTSTEKRLVIDRVGQWLRGEGRTLKERADDPMARLQNVMQVSVGWNDAECQAWINGVKLLTAFVVCKDTWLPDMIYNKAAKRAIKKIHDVLSEAMKDEKFISAPLLKNNVYVVPAVTKKEGSGYATHVPFVESIEQVAPKTDPQISTMEDNKPVVVRPKHIDQYVHLLPKKTQEKAATVRGLLRDLDTARENMRKLMQAGEHSDKMAQWARTATNLDEKVKKIYTELDAEWEKLVNDGRITIDIFGNAHVVEIENGELKIENSQGKDRKPELTTEQKHRRRELRKWLTDTRRGAEGKAREKRIEQWMVNIKEYLTLEPMEAALKDEKIVAAAEHFGIDIKAATEPQRTEKEPSDGQPTEQQ